MSIILEGKKRKRRRKGRRRRRRRVSVVPNGAGLALTVRHLGSIR